MTKASANRKARRRNKRETAKGKKTMRYITIPKPLPIPNSKDDKNDGPAMYGFDKILAECWSSADWRADDTSIQAFARVYAAFEQKKPGDVVELEGKDYEVFVPIISMRGRPIPNQLIAPLYNILVISVLTAPTNPPTDNGAEKALSANNEDVKKLPDKVEAAAEE